MSGSSGFAPRGSTLVALAFLGLGLVGAGLVVTTGGRGEAEARIARAASLVAGLALSDPALFTDARYTRNRSLADLHSAFQDGPASFEHFPTGSLVAPPRDLPAGRLEAGEE